MLTYSFTNLKNESLYMHLYQCIRQDIVDGKLVSGEKLPSKRSFAKNLGVSTITIENAYAQLLSEGYIYSIPKKGFYVSDFKNNVIKPVKLTTENVKLSSGQSDFLADFSSNQTRPENFPFSIWAKLMRETFNTNSPELMTSPGNRHPSGTISWNACTAGADFYWSRNRILIRTFNPASGI